MTHPHRPVLAVALACAIASLTPAHAEEHPVLAHADFDRVFAITTFEHRIYRSAERTAYPDTLERFEDLFALGGYRMEPPNEENEWYARTYLWAPSMMVMHLGETVLLEFFGINGEQHPSEIRAPDGAVIAEFEVARGEIAQVPFSPNMAGIHEFVSTQRLPGMVGQILVLDRVE
ncbi:MAG: putative periplasmic protein [Roseibaca calidilacus]|uniref:Putative periplasmic protein n=1 Tax=Roseibaca calidilacus TaxID=1666912 RepID=A0A0P8AGU6_9RHOB|nr:hypothetical protein [Roseibaca calidilacus]KPP93507.1 MAG: putative periplasmic protein [Roseibaca calidilacus]CUX80544.1 hypothetical protein Ga0058931_1196 [Roseibaca calidilacus]